MTEPATVRPVDVHDRTAAARLAYLSFREFYDLVPVPEGRVVELIGDQIGLAGSELADTYVATCDGAIAGMYAAFPAAKLRSAQMLSVVKLAAALPAAERATFMKAIDTFRQGIPLLDASTGWYLSRIAVDPGFLRRGIGRVLLEHFLEGARAHGEAWLHVHDANSGALAFYASHGFQESARHEKGYRLLRHPC